MRKTIFVFGLTVLLFCTASQAQEKGLGLGGFIGEPSGLCGKLWVTDTTAIDAAVSWSFTGNYSTAYLQGDYLLHDFTLVQVENGKLPIYYGLGARILSDTLSNTTQVGLRIPVGFSYLLEKAPFEVFVELAPVINFSPNGGFLFNGFIGGRYYFNTKK